MIHFLYEQVQPQMWFSNIVAGVVVFVVVDICWQWFLKKIVTKALHKIHAEQNALLHKKLNHIIHHSPDIPPLPKD